MLGQLLSSDGVGRGCCAAKAQALIHQAMKEAETTGEPKFVKGAFVPSGQQHSPEPEKPVRWPVFVRNSYAPYKSIVQQPKQSENGAQVMSSRDKDSLQESSV